MLRTEPVTVAVPATSANLGPGFDSLGLALALEDQVTARVSTGGVRVVVTGEGAGEVPQDESHLIVATMLRTFAELGVGFPAGLELSCVNRIPHARGLGSSSAAIVAGILLARALAGVDPDPVASLRLASEIEGHPDNVAACLLGGFTIAWSESGDAASTETASTPTGPTATGPTATGPTATGPTATGPTATGPTKAESAGAAAGGYLTSHARAVRLSTHPDISPTVYIPTIRGLTAHARAALPARVPHADASFNAARAALLVHALTSAPDLLFVATEDRLHQPYRAKDLPQTATLMSALRAAGVPAFVSGAGPTVLALPIGEGMTSALPEAPPGWRAEAVRVADRGGRILSVRHAGGDPVAAGLPS